MQVNVSALSAALLAFSWESDPQTTYTLQTSSDLLTWQTAPAIFKGTGDLLSYSVDNKEGPVFARIRSSVHDDTNENGLPDTWEWQTFGYIDVPPDDDPDLDGMTNLEEFRVGHNPLDLFNGNQTELRSRNGAEWVVTPGSASQAYLNLSCADNEGRPLPDLPVSVYLESRLPRLFPANGQPDGARDSWELLSDQFGNIGKTNGLRFFAETTMQSPDWIIINAGTSTLRIRVHPSLKADPHVIPRNISYTRIRGGPHDITWEGKPGTVAELKIEIYDPEIGWTTLSEIPSQALSETEPGSNLYNIQIPIIDDD